MCFQDAWPHCMPRKIPQANELSQHLDGPNAGISKYECLWPPKIKFINHGKERSIAYSRACRCGPSSASMAVVVINLEPFQLRLCLFIIYNEICSIPGMLFLCFPHEPTAAPQTHFPLASPLLQCPRGIWWLAEQIHGQSEKKHWPPAGCMICLMCWPAPPKLPTLVLMGLIIGEWNPITSNNDI